MKVYCYNCRHVRYLLTDDPILCTYHKNKCTINYATSEKIYYEVVNNINGYRKETVTYPYKSCSLFNENGECPDYAEKKTIANFIRNLFKRNKSKKHLSGFFFHIGKNNE